MIDWKKITSEETRIIRKIIKRTDKLLPIKDHMSAQMDVEAAHIEHKIKLEELLKADRFNLAHDVFGIMRNMNRSTGKLDNCFVPRYSK